MLDRFFSELIEQAPYAVRKSGRPSKLEEHDSGELFGRLQQLSTELGYEQQACSTKLLLYHLKEEYGVEFSSRHARKLLGKAELSWRAARPHNTGLVQNRRLTSKRQSKKRLGLTENTVVVVDQFTKRVGTVQRLDWYPIGSDQR